MKKIPSPSGTAYLSFLTVVRILSSGRLPFDSVIYGTRCTSGDYPNQNPFSRSLFFATRCVQRRNPNFRVGADTAMSETSPLHTRAALLRICAVPEGTLPLFYPAFPPLKRWAFLCRARGAVVALSPQLESAAQNDLARINDPRPIPWPGEKPRLRIPAGSPTPQPAG